MKQNAIESQQYSAEQLAKSLSSELDDLISIITRIDESRAMFWPSKWKNDLYNQTSISWELNKYRKYSFLMEDCILVYKNHNAVFTSTTHDCTDSFFQRVQVGDEQLSRILSTTNTRAILPVDMNDTTSDRRYKRSCTSSHLTWKKSETTYGHGIRSSIVTAGPMVTQVSEHAELPILAFR